MALVTYADMIARARRHAGQENSTFVSDAEIRSVLRTAVARLRQRLHRGGQEYERTSKELTTIPGQAIYLLPTDFARVLQLMANISAAQTGISIAGAWGSQSSTASQGWLPLFPFELAEMYQLLNVPDGRAENARYRLRGTNFGSEEVQPGAEIEILPVPRVAFTLRLEYLPTTSTDTADAAVIRGIDDFEEIPILEAAIYCLRKEESDTSALSDWLKMEMQRVDEVAVQDMTRPERVVDVYAQQHEAAGGIYGGVFERQWRRW